MNPNGSKDIMDIVISSILITIATLTFVCTIGAPLPLYDPLGSVALPRALCIIVAILSSIIFIKGIRNLKFTSNTKINNNADHSNSHYKKVVWVIFFTIIYIYFMDKGIVGFKVSTITFLTLSGWILIPHSRMLMIFQTIMALMIGIGGYYIMTKLFFIDLP